jgi:phenylalanyl-tRNA synthetase beta chain
MKVPLSWLKDFVDIELSVEDLAHRLTVAGLEVEEIRYVGLPMPARLSRPGGTCGRRPRSPACPGIRIRSWWGRSSKSCPTPTQTGWCCAGWRMALKEHIVLTGAPNLFPYKGQGPLENPLKVAYAREGARIYDGHQPGQVLTTLKRAKIRGVESYSMACSEKELGISEEHEGVILLDEDAPTGIPLVDYMGDAVLDIAITPNIARDANILGVAREIGRPDRRNPAPARPGGEDGRTSD